MSQHQFPPTTVQITVRRATAPKSNQEPRTIVMFVRKSGKKSEVIGANREMASLIEALDQDGLSYGDYKKGVLLRQVGPEPYPNVLVLAFDEKMKDLESVRKLGATVYNSLKSNKLDGAVVVFEALTKHFKGQAAGVTQAFSEGVFLVAYEYEEYKTKKEGKTESEGDDKRPVVKRIDLLVDKKSNPAALQKSIETAQILSECVNFARDLGNGPGNLMTPEILADRTVQAAKGTKLKVTVWDKARIKKEAFGGLLGVSLGSAVDPRFIIMEYNGAAKSKKPVCFVGKGLTFDSGGISIKPSGGMEEMKFDKCGGTAVIGTLLAIARLKLKVNAVGYVPSTENMPGPLANKPGDVLVARNGKTVEVDNTDAEGRLILMDALSYATEHKPAAIFDAATLTGACVVALGNIHTGVFTRSTKVRKKIAEAAAISGECVWAMPITDHHVNDMKGVYADLNNVSSVKGAGASTAAAFLEQFVDKDIPWAHFDIAGTAWHVGNRLNYCPRKGASGVMVRTFVEMAKIFG